MRNIIISTRWWDEEFELFCNDESQSSIRLTGNNNIILVIYNPNNNINPTDIIINELNSLDGEKIFLYHGPYTNLIPYINDYTQICVGTGGYDEDQYTPERKLYENLLENKLEAFDEVWNEFIKNDYQNKGQILIRSWIEGNHPIELPELFKINQLPELYAKVIGEAFNSSNVNHKTFRDALESLYK